MISKLRKILLPPESPQELFLRTLYHRLNATPWFINRQMRKAQASYLEWRGLQGQLPNVGVGITPVQAKVTFLLAVTDGKEAAALETLRSIQKTGTSNWQVLPVISDAHNWKEANLFIKDPRVLGSVQINNLASVIYELTGTDFVLFCSAGDLFDESFMENFQTSLSNNPAADIYYYDCEYQQG